MTIEDIPGDGRTLMSREIDEIPAAVSRLVRGEASHLDDVAAAVRRAHPRLAVVAARGTSDHAAVYARYLIESELRLPTAMAAPSLTTVYHRSSDWAGVLLLSLSQSGASPDILAVTEAARAGGATTVAITNDPTSPLARMAEHSIACHAGPERAVAATKTYVAELAAVAALVARLSPDPSLGVALSRLPEVLEETLSAAGRWLPLAEPLVDAAVSADRMLVVSRGYNFPTALEVALKFKETSGIFAEGYSSADLMHGPVALAQPRVPLLAFRPDGPMGAAIDGVIEHVTAAGSRVWLVGGRELDVPRPGINGALSLAVDLPETLTPLAFVIPGFVLVECIARRRGMNPDAPAGLSKVTLTM
jgi:glucosamine--fructose-6-phosphate aminotransferase (isomerizing)